jgi:hypothetical protein
MPSRVAVRAALLAALTLVALVVLAAPASAHTISGPKPSNYRSWIVSIDPPMPGVSVRVVDLGSQIELTNRTGSEAIVLGYVGEPYLRVGPDGAFENIHSEATYVNKGRKGGTVPEGVDTASDAKPEWRKISDGNSVRWHDHRAHWMSDQPPSQVQKDDGRFYQLSKQPIPVVHDGTRSEVVVELDWVPGPSGIVWIPVLAALFALGLFAALLPRWRIPLALLIGFLVLVDAAHSIAYVIPRPGTNLDKSLQFLAGSFVSVVIWFVSVPTIIGILRRKAEALYGVVFVGVMVALIGGATDLSALWKSQIPNAGPALATRLEVAISLGLGAGLATGAVVRMVRSGRRSQLAAGDGDGRWLSLLVVGLSDSELARIAHDLDADEVLEVATRELAARLEPASHEFTAGSLDVRVMAGDREHEWTLAAAGETVVAERGRGRAPAAVVHMTFPVALQLLAGTVPAADKRIRVDGDEAFYARIAPLVPERTTPVADAPASAL